MQILPDYTDQGSGTPVVLLHSSMSSKAQWGKLCKILEDRFRVIAIDLFGYGDADFPRQPEQFALAQEADRVGGLITMLIGDARFHLVGHSYGGATALRLAHDIQPQLISLCLYEPVAFHLLPETDPALGIIHQVAADVEHYVSKGDISSATGCFIDFWSGIGTYASIDAERQAAFDQFIRKVVLDFQAGIGEPLGLTAYAALNMPVCLIRSPESPLPTRRIVQLLEQALPSSELHEVPGGHMAPISHAQLVNPVIEQFLVTIERTL